MPKPSLAETCATLDRLLSGSSPTALLAAKPHIRDLVAGVAQLNQRVERLEDITRESTRAGT
jgi:hypothetical protein